MGISVPVGGCGAWRPSIPIRRIDEVLAEQRKIRDARRAPYCGPSPTSSSREEPTLCALNPNRVQHVYGLTHTTLSEPRKYECETAVLS